MNLFTQRKGESGQWFNIAVAVVFGVLIFAVLAIMLNALLSDNGVTCPSGYIYNASTNGCNEAANTSAIAPRTAAGNITNSGLTFEQNLTSQFGTAGTVLGVGILLVIVAALGIGGMAAYRRYR